MKDYMQWNPVYGWKRFLPPAGIEPGTARSSFSSETLLEYVPVMYHKQVITRN